MKLIKIFVSTFCFAITLVGMEQVAPEAPLLIKAAQRGDCDAIVNYKKAASDLNVIDCDYSALAYAVIFGHDEAAKMLLELGASPNIQDHIGQTILFYSRCSMSVFMAALAVNADPNIQDKRGKTVLAYWIADRADISGQYYRVALLLKHGAKVDVPDKDGKTPRDYAANYLKKLLVMNADELEKVIAAYK